MSLIYPLTFLDMVQRVHMETGTSGSSPSTVVGQVDQIARLVMWVSSAWMSFQTEVPDASFLRQTISFPLTVAVAEYSLTTIFSASQAATNTYTPDQYFGKWKLDTARIYTTATGTNDEFPLQEVRYDDWRDSYFLGALRNARSRPIVVADGPYGHELFFGPVPSAGYTCSTDFYLSPQPLLNDTDTPSKVLDQVMRAVGFTKRFLVPVQYNMLCVYKAMMDYGSYESAPEVYNRGEMGYKSLSNILAMKERPEITTGPPMA